MKGYYSRKTSIPSAGMVTVTAILLSTVSASTSVPVDQHHAFGISSSRSSATRSDITSSSGYMNQPLHDTNDDDYGSSSTPSRRNRVRDHRAISVDVHSKYVSAVQQVLKGSIEAPISIFGETIENERAHARGHNVRQLVTGRKEIAEQDVISQIDSLIGHTKNKLYGGSQYHRAVREMYILAHVSQIMCEVSDEEVAQMSGVSDSHDGPDYLRTVAKLALDKTFKSFETILDYFFERCVYIMKRMFYAVEHIANQQSYTSSFTGGSFFPSGGGYMSQSQEDVYGLNYEATERDMKDLVREIYERFVEIKAEETYKRCKDDLIAMTHFLSMDLNRGGSILNDQQSGKSKSKERIHEPLRNIEKDFAAMIARGGGPDGEEGSLSSMPLDDGDLVGGVMSKGDGALSKNEFAHLFERSTEDLVEHMLEVMNNRSPRINCVMSKVMGSLIRKLTWAWRTEFSNLVSMKFNCFFILPFHDEFNAYLREEMERIYQ